MFDTILNNLAKHTDADNYARALQQWDETWRRMDRHAPAGQSVGMLLSHSACHDLVHLDKLLEALCDHRSPMSTEDTPNCLRSAAGMLLASQAPVCAHTGLFLALGHQYKEIWNTVVLDKRAMMEHITTVSDAVKIMDALAYMYTLPNSHLSANDCVEILLAAGPVFAQRMALNGLKLGMNIGEKWQQAISAVLSVQQQSVVLLDAVESDKIARASTQYLRANCSLDDIFTAARTYNTAQLYALEHKTPILSKIFNKDTRAIIRWDALLDAFPNAYVGAENATALHSISAQLNLSANRRAEFEALLLRSVVAAKPEHIRARKI